MGRLGPEPVVGRVDPRSLAPFPVDATRHLDPRVWLVWMTAVLVPALVARNPFPLLALLVVVLFVRSAWAPALSRDGGWSFVLRFAVVASVISVLFNVLTAPFGDQILLYLPGWWLLGEVITANALIFGLLSAVAIVVIILAGTTAGLLADWPELLRTVPARFLPLAVAGSVAWAFVPQTVATLRDIRDAQRVRGIRLTSARTLIPILVPLLATSLERATTMAEALESRGFGGAAVPKAEPTRRFHLRSLLALVGLTAVVVGVYLLLDGSPAGGGVAVAVGTGLLVVALLGSAADTRSRYRRRVWRRRDTMVSLTASISLAATGWVLIADGDALRYSPYPEIPVPTINVPLILAIGLLLAPAVVAPLVPARVASSRTVLRPEVSSDGHAASAVAGAIEPVRTRQHQWRRSPTTAPIPWASWPPVIRSGSVPRQSRGRPARARLDLSRPRQSKAAPDDRDRCAGRPRSERDQRSDRPFPAVAVTTR